MNSQNPLCRQSYVFTRALSLVLSLYLLSAGSVFADDTTSTPSPIRIDRSKLSGVGLQPFAPWPAKMILEGESRHSYDVQFAGEFMTEIYEAQPVKLAIADPYPFDEFVYILSGRLILTDASGTTHAFEQGDSLVVPKGFTGTWEMQGLYRELVVIEADAYRRSEEAGGLGGDQ